MLINMTEVTNILRRIDEGDRSAAVELLPVVYDELRQLARVRLSREQGPQTLQPTALVHEAYLRLVGDGAADQWRGRGHFFGAAAQAMRRILIDNARRKRRHKHGGGKQPVSLDSFDVSEAQPPEELLHLDEALQRLESQMPEVARVVILRYFGGLQVEEVAEALGISVRTANRHWAYAKAWLFRQISAD